MMIGPLLPGVGGPKQAPLMNWLACKPVRGSQVNTGWTEKSGEPVMRLEFRPWLEVRTIPSGSFVPAGRLYETLKLFETDAWRFTPLWNCEMPEIFQPFTAPLR